MAEHRFPKKRRLRQRIEELKEENQQLLDALECIRESANEIIEIVSDYVFDESKTEPKQSS
jgi:uncharacterized coiled-coil DUF342 family protein